MRRILVVIALLPGCVEPGVDDPAACTGKCDGTSTDAAGQPLRDHLLANLLEQMNRGAVMFGHQRFNLTGVNRDGTQWLATPGNVDRSDAKTVSGQHPAVMGLDAFDLAIKPETWTPTPAVHAAAAKHVFALGGIVTLDWHMRGCTNTSSFNAAGNEGCLCRVANDAAFARSWLIDQNYAKLADALERFDLDQTPIVFRPLHEHDGNWFWWGQPYWNCSAPVTGPAAYQRVYRMIVDYLRRERGLDNLLFAYSPGGGDATRYLTGYPGDAYVDVLGLDLYYQAQPSFAEQTATFRKYIATMTTIAFERGKVAALTEVGNTQIATSTIPWYTEHLLPLLRDSHVAYAMTWENRRNAPAEFWLPFEGHTAVPDFKTFAADGSTWFVDDVPALYRAPADGYPVCASCSVDADGDGWGWEREASCRVGSWCLRP